MGNNGVNLRLTKWCDLELVWMSLFSNGRLLCRARHTVHTVGPLVWPCLCTSSHADVPQLRLSAFARFVMLPPR
jgi:hypothetical protein